MKLLLNLLLSWVYGCMHSMEQTPSSTTPNKRVEARGDHCNVRVDQASTLCGLAGTLGDGDHLCGNVQPSP